MPACKQCGPEMLGKVCPHYGPEVHGILTDLIAELRDGRECYLSGECCGVEARLDRAEARLRKVTGDE